MQIQRCSIINGIQTDRIVDFGTASKHQISLCRVWAMFLPTYRETPVTNHQLSADSWQALLFFATDKTVWLCSSTPRASYRGATLPYFNLKPQDKQNNTGQHCQGRHTMSELFLGDDKIWGYNLLKLQIMYLWTFDKEVEMSSERTPAKTDHTEICHEREVQTTWQQK